MQYLRSSKVDFRRVRITVTKITVVLAARFALISFQRLILIGSIVQHSCLVDFLTRSPEKDFNNHLTFGGEDRKMRLTVSLTEHSLTVMI